MIWLAVAAATVLTQSVSPPLPAEGRVQGFQSASELHDKCVGSSIHGQQYCYAYLAAVGDSITAYQSWLNLSDVCIPAATTQGELKDAFIGYLVNHPSQTRAQAASVAVTALQARFPCAVAATREPKAE